MTVTEMLQQHGAADVRMSRMAEVRVEFATTDSFNPVALGIKLGTLVKTEANPNGPLIEPSCEYIESNKRWRLLYSILEE
jgi:hypothetical protein